MVIRTIIISINILLDIALSSNVGILVIVVTPAVAEVVDDVAVVVVVVLDSISGLGSFSSCTALHQQFVQIQKYIFCLG